MSKSELAGFWPKLSDAGIMAGNCQNRRNSAVLVGLFWPDPASQSESAISDDIDPRLSDFGTGKISVMVDCFNVKVDCVV
jgi:hypothetical protein